MALSKTTIIHAVEVNLNNQIMASVGDSEIFYITRKDLEVFKIKG